MEKNKIQTRYGTFKYTIPYGNTSICLYTLGGQFLSEILIMHPATQPVEVIAGVIEDAFDDEYVIA